ncbi:hypothetical protein FRC06_005652 [Ceratobasidium sp. 370]|nr:hypothetical protein FRC06_005652 [Ceratobasidium sp. 370]
MSTSFLKILPTEILTQCLAALDPRSLLTMLSVSSELRSVASQDVLWEPHCESIYNKGCIETAGWRKVHKADILPDDYDAPNLPYHMAWRRMRLYEDYLGWWLSLEQGPAGIIMHITLRGDRLVVSHAIPTSGAPVLGNSRGHLFALSWYNNSHNPLIIDSDSVIVEEYSVLSVQWLFKGPSSIMHHKYSLRTFHTSEPGGDSGRSGDQLPKYDWLSHRSPSLFAAIRRSGVSVDDQGPFIALRSPFEASATNSLIASGIWLASYGQLHGYEFIYIQIRRIAEADLTRPWGAEQNLADAFSPELRDLRAIFELDDAPPSELSEEDLRVGDRIIEAIKITGLRVQLPYLGSILTRAGDTTGDVNVPRGVRTFVGFLDHNSSWSGPREDGEFVARPASHPWPIHPEFAIQSEMAVTALPARLADMQEQDVPARGMTLPGLMRVADTGFVDPKWANVTVHIASRREIKVMIQEGHHVTTFYKIEQDMLHSIR